MRPSSRAKHRVWKVMVLTGAADGHIAVWNITSVMKAYHALAKQSEQSDVITPIDILPIAAAQARSLPAALSLHEAPPGTVAVLSRCINRA